MPTYINNAIPNWATNSFQYTTAATTTNYFTYAPFPAAPSVPEPESDVAWLRRRVREITDLAPR